MANYNVRYNIEFTDANGQRAVTRIPVEHADTATLANLVTEFDAVTTIIGGPGAANGLSNAKVTNRSISIQRDHAQILTTPQPVDGQAYPGVRQQAQLHFANANGAKGMVSIPAPVDDNVMGEPPGDDLVNATLDLPTAGVSGLATLITWLTGHMANASGTSLNLFTGGALKGGKVSRRRARNHL